MSHMLYSCDCGKRIHLPAWARAGFVWSCRRCGRSYVLGNGGRSGVLVPSLPRRTADLTLTCCDCGRRFTLSAGERRFFILRGLETPKRCPTCRKRKHKGLWATFLQLVYMNKGRA